MSPAVWKGISGVTEVVLIRDSRNAKFPTPRSAVSHTIIIPLDLDSIRRCPPHYPSLVPNALALTTLGNKKAFALYVAANDLEDFCPTTFWTEDEVVFPCVLKRTDLLAGIGVVVVHSRDELHRILESEFWKNKEVVMQALISGATEYVTHCICRNGRILWHLTFEYELDDPDQIRISIAYDDLKTVDISPSTLALFERILIGVGYDGPCCVNYKISANGDVSIFEINPRFGGSLMLRQHVGYLREALGCLVKAAL